MNKSAKIITIYTDGACSPNPGPGGWAAILRWEGKEKVLTGGEGQTTNNRMELTAAVQALAALKEPSQVCIFTDSQYLQKGITEWLPGWLKRNWRTTSGKVANQDLWQALMEAEKPHQVEWNWLRGHAGSPENSRVDRLARQAAAQASKN
jgi:ribonuclease HI